MPRKQTWYEELEQERRQQQAQQERWAKIGGGVAAVGGALFWTGVFLVALVFVVMPLILWVFSG